jgi:hypothetical protein
MDANPRGEFHVGAGYLCSTISDLVVLVAEERGGSPDLFAEGSGTVVVSATLERRDTRKSAQRCSSDG